MWSRQIDGSRDEMDNMVMSRVSFFLINFQWLPWLAAKRHKLAEIICTMSRRDGWHYLISPPMTRLVGPMPILGTTQCTELADLFTFSCSNRNCFPDSLHTECKTPCLDRNKDLSLSTEFAQQHSEGSEFSQWSIQEYVSGDISVCSDLGN